MKEQILLIMTVLMFLGINQKLLSQNTNIEITHTRNPDKSVDFSFTKKLPGSYYLKVEFPTLENSYKTEFEGVIKNNSGRLLKLSPINKEQPVNFSYTFSFVRGNPDAKIDTDFLYVLPFSVGSSIDIVKSANLKEEYFNAEKNPNWNSFIVDRESADTVFNMRKGIVIEVIDEFKADLTDAYKYTSNLNKILIEHEDGSIARYTGFNNRSIFVKPGQTVYPQTKLGALDIFNNSVYRLYFDIYHLKKMNLDTKEKRTLSSEDQSEHINPIFYSPSGPFTLNSNNKYIVEFDDTILFKEFTNREKRTYKKSPLAFE